MLTKKRRQYDAQDKFRVALEARHALDGATCLSPGDSPQKALKARS
jgi:hypothetical protein